MIDALILADQILTTLAFAGIGLYLYCRAIQE